MMSSCKETQKYLEHTARLDFQGRSVEDHDGHWCWRHVGDGWLQWSG